MDEEELSAIKKWVAVNAKAYLSETVPGLITNAEPSKAVRFRWFNVSIGGKTYKMGANVHYGGSMGALWIVNGKDQTAEFHPYAPPVHGLTVATAQALCQRCKSHKDPIVSALHKLIT